MCDSFSARVEEKSLKAAWHFAYSGSALTASVSPLCCSTNLRAMAAAPSRSFFSLLTSSDSP